MRAVNIRGLWHIYLDQTEETGLIICVSLVIIFEISSRQLFQLKQ